MIHKITRDGILLILDSALVIPLVCLSVILGIVFESFWLVVYVGSFQYIFTKVVSIYERDREGLSSLVRNLQSISTSTVLEVPEQSEQNIPEPNVPECFNKQISGS